MSCTIACVVCDLPLRYGREEQANKKLKVLAPCGHIVHARCATMLQVRASVSSPDNYRCPRCQQLIRSVAAIHCTPSTDEAQRMERMISDLDPMTQRQLASQQQQQQQQQQTLLSFGGENGFAFSCTPQQQQQQQYVDRLEQLERLDSTLEEYYVRLGNALRDGAKSKDIEKRVAEAQMDVNRIRKRIEDMEPEKYQIFHPTADDATNQKRGGDDDNVDDAALTRKKEKEKEKEEQQKRYEELWRHVLQRAKAFDEAMAKLEREGATQWKPDPEMLRNQIRAQKKLASQARQQSRRLQQDCSELAAKEKKVRRELKQLMQEYYDVCEEEELEIDFDTCAASSHEHHHHDHDHHSGNDATLAVRQQSRDKKEQPPRLHVVQQPRQQQQQHQQVQKENVQEQKKHLNVNNFFAKGATPSNSVVDYINADSDEGDDDDNDDEVQIVSSPSAAAAAAAVPVLTLPLRRGRTGGAAAGGNSLFAIPVELDLPRKQMFQPQLVIPGVIIKATKSRK